MPAIGSGVEAFVRVGEGASPEAVFPGIRRALRQLDSEMVVDEMQPMQQVIAESIARQRFAMLLFSVFAGAALLLASIGIYGVLSYVVGQRTREIGIRMALGARRETVMRLVMADIVWLAGISMAITLPLAMLASRAVRSQLYNVSPADPVVIASGVVIVTLVVIASALLPARRAASVEPMEALRTE